MTASFDDSHMQLINSTGYVLLLMDGLKILIPQDQVIALETITALDVSKADNYTVGHFQFSNKTWPVYCFSHNLTILSSVNLNQKFCVLLQTENNFFGILSEQALLLKSQDIRTQLLPESMMIENSPITELAIYNKEVCSISSAELLARFLPLNITKKTT